MTSSARITSGTQAETLRTVPVTAIIVGDRFRRDLGDIDGLAQSIADVGLLSPITVAPSGALIAGARRLTACRQLGWAEVPVHVVDLAEIVRGEYAENTARKGFVPSELVAIERALAPLVQTPVGRPRNGAKLAPGETVGKTRDKVAAFAGVGHTTLAKATAVVEAAEADPERFGNLVPAMDKSGKVDGAYRELRRRQTWSGRTSVAPPVATYRTLVIDPPWPYEQRKDDGSHRGVVPYPTMAIEAIIADTPLPVADDAWVWLWTTNHFLPDAFRVLEAWGLTYRATFVWVKSGALGVGEWARIQTEYVLFATRGDLRSPRSRVPSNVIIAPRGGHSEKPDEFYELVEGFSPAPRIDIYARRERDGWTSWGNEVGAPVGETAG